MHHGICEGHARLENLLWVGGKQLFYDSPWRIERFRTTRVDYPMELSPPDFMLSVFIEWRSDGSVNMAIQPKFTPCHAL